MSGHINRETGCGYDRNNCTPGTSICPSAIQIYRRLNHRLNFRHGILLKKTSEFIPIKSSVAKA
jgi:hypothetical protein